MKFRPRDIAILSMVALAIAAALFFVFGPLSNSEPVADPSPSSDVVAPLPQATTQAPQVTVDPSATATPSNSVEGDLTSGWDKPGSGPGMLLDDPDSNAAKAVALEFIPLYQNRYGYQQADSASYLDGLLEKGLITQGFYDARKEGGSVPSKTAEKQIEVITPKIDCPMTSQSGPVLIDGKGSFKCFYLSNYAINGSTVDRGVMDEVGLPWLAPNEKYSMTLSFVKDGDTWKVDGIK